MADSKRRPSVTTKHIQIHAQEHLEIPPAHNLVASRYLDSLVVGLGYASLATYLCTRFHKFSPWELASISLGSMVLGYGLFDLGKRAGMVQGASYTLQNGDGKTGQGEGQDWRGEFTGMEHKQLNNSEKIVWLKKEEVRIREMQGEKQLNCGKAYIAKEGAYVAYEKHGGYGGPDWKRYLRSYGKRS
jgi:hypothetical protein